MRFRPPDNSQGSGSAQNFFVGCISFSQSPQNVLKDLIEVLKEKDKTKYIKRVASPHSLIKKVPFAGTLLAFQHLFHPPVWEKKKEPCSSSLSW